MGVLRSDLGVKVFLEKRSKSNDDWSKQFCFEKESLRILPNAEKYTYSDAQYSFECGGVNSVSVKVKLIS